MKRLIVVVFVLVLLGLSTGCEMGSMGKVEGPGNVGNEVASVVVAFVRGGPFYTLLYPSHHVRPVHYEQSYVYFQADDDATMRVSRLPGSYGSSKLLSW